MPVKIISYKGQDIVYADYSNYKQAEDMLAVLDELDQLMESTPGNFCLVSNFKKAFASKVFMQKAKELAPKHQHRFAKKACFGLEGVQLVLLSTFNFFMKKSARTVHFSSEKEALDYLAS